MSSPLFWNFGGRFNPPAERGADAHYEVIFDSSKKSFVLLKLKYTKTSLLTGETKQLKYWLTGNFATCIFQIANFGYGIYPSHVTS